MINFASKFPHTLTLWAAEAVDLYGDASFAAPKTFKGRFEQRDESVLDSDGEEKKATSVFYTKEVIVAGDYLAEGDKTGSADPTVTEDAGRVISLRKVPSVRNNQTLFVAFT